MTDLAFRADLKLATATLDMIELAVKLASDDGLRPHLGASLIGRPCERELWYRFRWAKPASFDGRMLRLFARGQREEDVMADLLREAGVKVVQADPNSGEQYRFATGHFGGSMDAACVNLPEAPQTWHVVEMKTHGKKSFDALAAQGVKDAKPEHWAQMQCYMAWTGMERALYMAVCKDDDRLHLERIDFDRQAASVLFERAQRIIEAPEPLPGISERADWYQCKLCDYHAFCHADAAPLPTCRTCAHVTPIADGHWYCERNSKTLDVAAQKAACQGHRYIPVLLARFAEAVEADTEGNWIKYRNKKTGNTFTNGLPPEGFESSEIHAAQDKAALGDPGVQGFREVFDARVAA